MLGLSIGFNDIETLIVSEQPMGVLTVTVYLTLVLTNATGFAIAGLLKPVAGNQLYNGLPMPL
jgi:hypothetical protein